MNEGPADENPIQNLSLGFQNWGSALRGYKTWHRDEAGSVSFHRTRLVI